MSEKPISKRHLNAAEKRELRSEELRLFLKQVGRKAQKGVEPNDRKHSRKVELSVKRMDAETFDSLIRGDDSDAT